MLSFEIALGLVRSALEVGGKKGVPVAVAVIDIGGRVMASARSEHVGFLNLDVAQRKASAALNFKAPTHAVLEMLKADAIALTAVMSETSLCVLPGGFPVLIDGATVGALGIAGGHYSQDHAIGEESLASVLRG